MPKNRVTPNLKWFDSSKTLKIRRKKVPERCSSEFNDKKSTALCPLLRATYAQRAKENSYPLMNAEQKLHTKQRHTGLQKYNKKLLCASDEPPHNRDKRNLNSYNSPCGTRTAWHSVQKNCKHLSLFTAFTKHMNQYSNQSGLMK
jgi:hypothetical protein